MIGSLLTNSAYDYDDANRLVDVNGVTYTWEDNGNLLNDGVNTYTEVYPEPVEGIPPID